MQFSFTQHKGSTDGNYSLVITNTSAEKQREKQVSQVPKTSQRHSFPPFPHSFIHSSIQSSKFSEIYRLFYTGSLEHLRSHKPWSRFLAQDPQFLILTPPHRAVKTLKTRVKWRNAGRIAGCTPLLPCFSALTPRRESPAPAGSVG